MHGVSSASDAQANSTREVLQTVAEQVENIATTIASRAAAVAQILTEAHVRYQRELEKMCIYSCKTRNEAVNQRVQQHEQLKALATNLKDEVANAGVDTVGVREQEQIGKPEGNYCYQAARQGAQTRTHAMDS